MYSTLVQVIILALAVVYTTAVIPEQIRITLTGDGNHVISWTTCSSANKKTSCPSGTTKTQVRMGYSKSSLSTVVQGTSNKFTYGKYHAIIHDTVIKTSKAQGSVIYYQVGDFSIGGNAISEVLSFKVSLPSTWSIFGDYGMTNIGRSYDALINGAKTGEYDGVIHIGDIAYDLHNSNGLRGDEFLNSVYPISAAMPYLFTPGNHEKEGNFTHYINRFSSLASLGSNSKSNTVLWYSFKVPLIHFTTIDTEVYSYFPDLKQQARQIKWLKADLEQANKERKTHPWLIVLGHKCDWHDLVQFDDFRALLHSYGVDLYICGHQHNYQRLYPGLRRQIDHQADPHKFINPKYWTQVVVGSPGCQEKISKGGAPYKNGIASHLLTYGYGILKVHNTTHLEWKFMQTNLASYENGNTASDGVAIEHQNRVLGLGADTERSVQDYMWIIQPNHGPRLASDFYKSTPPSEVQLSPIVIEHLNEQLLAEGVGLNDLPRYDTISPRDTLYIPSATTAYDDNNRLLSTFHVYDKTDIHYYEELAGMNWEDTFEDDENQFVGESYF